VVTGGELSWLSFFFTSFWFKQCFKQHVHPPTPPSPVPSLKTEQYRKTLERVDFDVVSKPAKWRFLETQCAEILEKGVPVGVDTETTGLSAR